MTPDEIVRKYTSSPETILQKYGDLPFQTPELPPDPPTLMASDLYADVPPVKTPELPPYQPPPMRDRVLGALETPLVIGSRAALEIPANVVGVGRAIGAGLGESGIRKGMETAEQVRNLAYQPRTESAVDYTRAIGGALSGFEGVPIPIAMQLGQATQLARSAVPTQRALAQGARTYERHLESSARAPQIDAAADAQRLGVLLNPADVDPTLRNRLLVATADEARVNRDLSQRNTEQLMKVAKREMGMREDAVLKSDEPFANALAAKGKAYDRVAALPTMQADSALKQKFASLLDLNPVPGKEDIVRDKNMLVSKVLAELDEGIDGARAVRIMQEYRRDGNFTLDRERLGQLSAAEKERAQAQISVANYLEELIGTHLNNKIQNATPQERQYYSGLLSSFQDARVEMAKIYGYKRATDYNTGMLDFSKIAADTRVNPNMTGNYAAIGRIVGNYPDSVTFTGKPRLGPPISRGTVGGAAGALIGATVANLTGMNPYAMSSLGLMAGVGSQRVLTRSLANQLAAGRYQAQPRDFRIPPEPPPPQRLLGYTPGPERAPDEVVYTPNFLFGNELRPPDAPQIRPDPQMMSEPTRRTVLRETEPPMLPSPSAESTMGALRTEDARRAAMSRTLGQEEEARMAAAERAARQPAGEGMPLNMDPFTGKLQPSSRGLPGATPETFENYGASLESAAKKVQGLARPTMTADEKIAWDRTRVDLELADKNFSKLSDAQVAKRLGDLAWVQLTLQKVRAREKFFADKAARQGGEANARYRQQMSDLAEYLEKQLEAPRPVRTGSQGRKTREAKAEEQRKNMLAPPSQNNLEP
jgi:hypothetical protein